VAVAVAVGVAVGVGVGPARAGDTAIMQTLNRDTRSSDERAWGGIIFSFLLSGQSSVLCPVPMRFSLDQSNRKMGCVLAIADYGDSTHATIRWEKPPDVT
jgi:hypothetical protein